ncbi:hypothetical protein SAMN05421543_11961 [Alicyclobacillus macrosporangiidus]|uniref:Uncharacterized protein n=1 Tax=Alicyclobacillus macrosporangiidus TaxID=392015 RepID=A0A1I7KV15_9BACL|nr:hypothetical protein SAMN05421543_11961 [Alicyclobacillus macrosporangiidus]
MKHLIQPVTDRVCLRTGADGTRRRLGEGELLGATGFRHV